jgi:hypothetical protein
MDARVYIAPGADRTQPWWNWSWIDITQYVRFDLGVSVTAGRRDERSRVTASRAVLKLDNRDGRFSRKNPTGPYYGMLSRNTPIRMSNDPGSGPVDRYFGFVNEWPKRWTDATGNDSTTTITCGGILRRLAQGEVLKSALYRSISGRTPGSLIPVVYWPMEDAAQSTQFASAVSGIAAVVPTGAVTFAADSSLAGSDPLPSFAAGATATFDIPAYTSTGAWSLQMAIKVPSNPASDTVIARITTGGEGANARYEIVLSPSGSDSVNFVGYDSAGAATTISELLLDGSGPAQPLAADFYGNWWSLRVSEKTFGDGTGIITSLFLSGTESREVAQATVTGIGQPSSLRTVTISAETATAGINFGHAAVHNDAALIPSGAVTQDVLASVGALSGWSGEQAHERVVRLCREEGVPSAVTATTSAAMGPQGSGTLVDVLRKCESADLGLLYEYQFGLAYQALSERYNQAAALALDIAQKHIVMPETQDDDQRLRNEWTISREGGSSATFRDQASIDAEGLYDDSATLNVEADSQLLDIAAFKTHLGINDDERWPRVPVYLHRHTSVIAQWVATRLGDLATIDSPPDQLAPDQILAVIEGYTEAWRQTEWHFGLVTSPGAPYVVAVLDSAVLGRLDSGSSSLASGITTTATSFSVATTDASDLWITGTGLAIPLLVGGEVMSVGTISGAGSPQTFSDITRSVNGVVKAHSAGDEVHVRDPARLAL